MVFDTFTFKYEVLIHFNSGFYHSWFCHSRFYHSEFYHSGFWHQTFCKYPAQFNTYAATHIFSISTLDVNQENILYSSAELFVKYSQFKRIQRIYFQSKCTNTLTFMASREARVKFEYWTPSYPCIHFSFLYTFNCKHFYFQQEIISFAY